MPRSGCEQENAGKQEGARGEGSKFRIAPWKINKEPKHGSLVQLIFLFNCQFC